MSRIMLTWELGMNLGHLARLLPVAQKLKERGHAVLVAARDLAAAAIVLGPAGISFVQAPHLPQGIPLPHRPTGYADILLSQGWADRDTLWGLTQGWINLYRMFRPDTLIIDYSPTARLAAYIADLPVILVGNGFELPPATDPLPPFPGFSWATQEKASMSECIAITNACAIARSFKKAGPHALRDAISGDAVLLATLPELDHYGAREDACYVGPLLGKIYVERAEWPEGSRGRIFACLRPDTKNVEAILSGLFVSTASVVCFSPGFTRQSLNPYRRSGMQFFTQPVDLDHLAFESSLCVSYGAEGTMAKFLLAGVPQLISPTQVEAHMAARRIESIGVGFTLHGVRTGTELASLIDVLIRDEQLHQRAKQFSRRQHVGMGTCLNRKAVEKCANEALIDAISAFSELQMPSAMGNVTV